MSLSDELKRAAARDILRLHTPGHKGALCSLDLTELTDDSFPADFVLQAERRVAAAYGAKHARFLCGGSSQGVKSAIYYAACDAVIDVNSHRSVFDGFRLSGKDYVSVGEKDSIYPITVEQIQSAITPHTRAVVVTTPTYYGFCADIDGIADFCKKRGLLFVADSAHGAHFGFSNKLPKSVAPVCDICNVSSHKTLGALTQSAVLLDNLDRAAHAALGGVADIMGTTSPSYLLYASIDEALTAAKNSRAAYDALYGAVAALKSEFPFLNTDDFTRLVLDCNALGVNPRSLNGALARRGVQSERVDGRYIVFIITAADGPETIARFSAALGQSISEIK